MSLDQYYELTKQMKTNLLDTKTLSFREMIGDGKKYQVPLYQRDYSWKEAQWEELWTDVKSLIDKNQEIHYMGAIVVQNERLDENFKIIDGQQRFVTLSLLILSALKVLRELSTDSVEKTHNDEREKILRDTYLGNKDAVSLTYSNKISLNENNNNFYQTYLIQLKSVHNRNRLNSSDKLMYAAFEYFIMRIKEESFSTSGEKITQFINSIIGNSLLFIQIAVDDDVSAYTVFETLNARGVGLTSTDLLKNYLFSLIQSQTDINNIKVQWQNIIKNLDIKELPKFLRYYLNSKNRLIRSERLFKEMKVSVKSAEDVFILLDDLEKNVDIYTALDEPENELWKHNADIKKLIEEIVFFGTDQQKPLLMRAYQTLEMSEFEKVLRILKAIIFRYTVIGGLNPNRLEEAYNKVAVKLHNKTLTRASDINKELKDIYVSDEDFKNNFSTKTFDTKNSKKRKLVRYILTNLENQLYQKSFSPLEIDATVEHVLPENPSQDWFDSFKHNDVDNNIYRLGNMTLLEEKLNGKEAANKIFNDKKIIYQKSQYEMSQALFSKDEWTQDEIRGRQSKLASAACSVWKATY